jgi:hypothetical protein
LQLENSTELRSPDYPPTHDLDDPYSDEDDEASFLNPEDERTQMSRIWVNRDAQSAVVHSSFYGRSIRIPSAGSRITFQVRHHPTGKIQEKTLTPDSIIQGGGLIGRHKGCDIVLNSPEVSRVHGRVAYLAGHYYFTDLGSTVGSLINGERIATNQNTALNLNDLIQIGKYTLLVKELELEERRSTPHAVHTAVERDSSDEFRNGSGGYGNSGQAQRLMFKAEELEVQGISTQSESELVFQGRQLVAGLSLSKRLRQRAIDLWQSELNTGRFCLLVEYDNHFTIWQEE